MTEKFSGKDFQVEIFVGDVVTKTGFFAGRPREIATLPELTPGVGYFVGIRHDRFGISPLPMKMFDVHGNVDGEVVKIERPIDGELVQIWPEVRS